MPTPPRPVGFTAAIEPDHAAPDVALTVSTAPTPITWTFDTGPGDLPALIYCDGQRVWRLDADGSVPSMPGRSLAILRAFLATATARDYIQEGT